MYVNYMHIGISLICLNKIPIFLMFVDKTTFFEQRKFNSYKTTIKALD